MKEWPKWVKVALGVVGGLLGLVIAIGMVAPAQPGEVAPPPEPTPDASARVACRHFSNVADDIRAGVLTDAELREKLKEVHESASVSEVAEVRIAAEQMLRGITSGDGDELQAGVSAMVPACAEALAE